MRTSRNLVALTSMFAACSGSSGDAAGPDASVAEIGDGGSPDGSTASSLCDPDSPFGEPVPVPGLGGDYKDASYATFDDDELTVYLSYVESVEPVLRSYIGTAKRPNLDAPFGAPVELVRDEGSGTAISTSVSRDGLTMAYLLPNPSLVPDLLYAHRDSREEPWGESAVVAWGVRMSFVHLGSDGQDLYWGSTDPYYPDEYHDGRILTARMPAPGPTDSASAVPGIDTDGEDDYAPVLSADGLEIFWVIDDEYPHGGEMRYARRASLEDSFTVVEEFEGFGDIDLLPTFYSRDRCRLYMTLWDNEGDASVVVARRTSP